MNNDNEELNIFICPICNQNYSYLTTSERTKHVNGCLDNTTKKLSKTTKTSTFDKAMKCNICNKNLTNYNTIRRQDHMEKCLSKWRGEKKISKQFDSFVDLDEDEKQAVDSTICHICGMKLFNLDLISRKVHLDQCKIAYRFEPTWESTVSSINKSGVPVPQLSTKIRSTKRKRKKKHTQEKNISILEKEQIALGIALSKPRSNNSFKLQNSISSNTDFLFSNNEANSPIQADNEQKKPKKSKSKKPIPDLWLIAQQQNNKIEVSNQFPIVIEIDYLK
ncbi:btb poz domain containing 12 [Anaeramoeba flamelloides]|uniref:Btb poz domain containing 12 n=1 Tax=Anaeramoeba flamelloides TaxID=1746091 RepID=A0ABQ8XK42_9EUKA|nr:btb poz domain containing 12 [Anaeramoeba flamelloides]